MHDRLNSRALLMDVSHRRITRLKIRALKRTFPFLELPPELRNATYEFCLTRQIDMKAFFDAYYAKLKENKKQKMPVPQKWMPNNVLLINKQVNTEASYLLVNQSIVFDHGLFRIKDVQEVVSVNLLRTVTAIKITDVGHPIIKSRVLAESWHGYMRLFEQLAEQLSKGHNLKTFTIEFADHRMHEHMNTCWGAQYECGFRDQIKEKTEKLRSVRGVGCVTIKGINEGLAKSLKHRMESLPPSFDAFPREVRDMVYEAYFDGNDWNNVNSAIVVAAKQETNDVKQLAIPALQTPSLLLVSKQIASEATKLLRTKPLTFNFPTTHSLILANGIVSMMKRFIGRATLQNVTILHLNISAWEWISACTGKNFINPLARSKALEQLTITFNDVHKHKIVMDPGCNYRDRQLHDWLKNLTMIRGLRSVEFRGVLPDSYTRVFKRIMTSPKVEGEDAARFFVEYGHGSVVDIEDAA